MAAEIGPAATHFAYWLTTPHDGLWIVDRGLGLAGKLLAAEILDDAGIGRRKTRGAG